MSDLNDQVVHAPEPSCALGLARAREDLLAHRLAQVEAELGAIHRAPLWRVLALLRRVRRRLERQPRLLPAWRLRPLRLGSARRLRKAKQTSLARAEGELDALLRGAERVALPRAGSPRVSILLVLFNQAALTLACLRAIAAKAGVPVEVIIVDNASIDRTGALLERLDGARILRNAENLHFLRAVNQAAALATGEALLLLNNDALIRDGTLPAACATLFGHADAGAVGGPIVLPDGTLQEAGSIIWRDGTCVGYGRGGRPEAPEFRFLREVDYCSAAFLLVRRQVFEALGGLDPAFAPAYYEETDFCMRLRGAGWRVLYEPCAAIDHYEFASATSASQALALQRRQHGRFVEHHRTALDAGHRPPGSAHLQARMRGKFRGRVLVIEDRVPYPALGAGYPRAASLLRELIEHGWFVTLYPLLIPRDDEAAIRAAFPAEMEVMLGHGRPGLRRFLRARRAFYDAVLVSRPHNMRGLLAAGGARLAAGELIYDAEAVFADRDLGRLALQGKAVAERHRRARIEREMRLARAAGSVIAVSEHDAAQFRDAGCRDVHVLGHALRPAATAPGFARRTDLLFVGALDDDRSPNADSLLWFAAEVMPRLDALIGDTYRLLIAGRCAADRILALAGARVRLFGQVADLAPLYASTRLLIAPTRFAAGIPFKVHEAAARGVPVVATSLLARQLGWTDGVELLTGDTPEAFADACARAYRDAGLWRDLRDAALARVTADCDPQVFARQVRAIMASRATRRG